LLRYLLILNHFAVPFSSLKSWEVTFRPRLQDYVHAARAGVSDYNLLYHVTTAQGSEEGAVAVCVEDYALSIHRNMSKHADDRFYYFDRNNDNNSKNDNDRDY